MKLLLIVLLIPFSLMAEVCEKDTSLDWILGEIELNHPKIILSRLNLEKVEADRIEAGKFINPEVEHFSVWGKEFAGVKSYQNESRLWFTLQLAGKRGKGLSAWAKQYDMAKHEELMLKQSLLKDLWINFFRIHQIIKETNVRQALILKLNKVITRYKERRYLTKDQKLELQIFTMVVNKLSLSLHHLDREKTDILSFFREITAFRCPITKIAAEEKSIQWPDESSLKNLGSIEPLNVELAKLKIETSQAQLRLADSKKVPNLRFSPVVQNYINDEVNNTMAGLAFVMPLPIFDTNQSERIKLHLENKFSQRNLEVTKNKEEHYFQIKLNKYLNGLSILNDMNLVDDGVKIFEELGSTFAEGKLTISNIVEFCRQLDESLQYYHYSEAVLMRDLIEIYEQKGKLSAQTLQQLI
jgi:hypothetical protein